MKYTRLSANYRLTDQIPAYRDPECQITIDDMFAKAELPERCRHMASFLVLSLPRAPAACSLECACRSTVRRTETAWQLTQVRSASTHADAFADDPALTGDRRVPRARPKRHHALERGEVFHPCIRVLPGHSPHHPASARGPCLARHMAQALWDGEEFHLQIDSHTRCAKVLALRKFDFVVFAMQLSRGLGCDAT